MFRKARRLHFVGIGGSGMSGIAEVLVNMGYRVSGSDQAANAATRRLKRLGADVRRGHAPEHVHGADVVVTSTAVREDNPEVVEARRQQIPVIPRAEMLAELMRLKHAVLVSGAHGKTSTTAMIAEVLNRGGLDPTVVIGGRVGRRSGAKLGTGDLMVAEADESDGSFLKMKPTIAVVTNIDREHLDHYPDLEAIRAAFAQFVSRVPFYGEAVVCGDDPNVRGILPRLDRRVITYGLRPDADVRAVEVGYSGFESTYRVSWHGKPLGIVRLQVPGEHSVYNSLAAVAVGLELELPFDKIAQGLAAFRGADRRFQYRGEAHGVLVVDDYAHHPTEIRATLQSVRAGIDAPVRVVFQPHRYTRTQHLLEEFGRSFDGVEQVIVTDVYPAGEQPIAGIDGPAVVRELQRLGHPNAFHLSTPAEVARLLERSVRAGDVLLTLGAGDVWKFGEEFMKSDAGRINGSRARARWGGSGRLAVKRNG